MALALDAPLDVFVVRKLGLPGHPEYAMGAIASGGARVLNEDAVRLYPIPKSVIDDITRHEQLELERRERVYREGRPAIDLRGRVVILVDDGLATGSTMKAAVGAARAHAPAGVVVAAPVGSPDTCREVAAIADEIVCGREPEHCAAVGQWYDDFRQTTDDEVRALLHDGSSQLAGKER